MMSETLGRELRRVICGDKLGEGSSRKVYVCALNDGYVIKVEVGGQSFQNIAEWEIWSWVKSRPHLAKWFAPCHNISPSGLVLVQRRVLTMREHELPKTMPAFLCDFKRENFGLLDKRIVCCDYGTVMSMFQDFPTKAKMVKVKWK